MAPDGLTPRARPLQGGRPRSSLRSPTWLPRRRALRKEKGTDGTGPPALEGGAGAGEAAVGLRSRGSRTLETAGSGARSASGPDHRTAPTAGPERAGAESSAGTLREAVGPPPTRAPRETIGGETTLCARRAAWAGAGRGEERVLLARVASE